jgi:hypothetical protein
MGLKWAYYGGHGLSSCQEFDRLFPGSCQEFDNSGAGSRQKFAYNSFPYLPSPLFLVVSGKKLRETAFYWHKSAYSARLLA